MGAKGAITVCLYLIVGMSVFINELLELNLSRQKNSLEKGDEIKIALMKIDTKKGWNIFKNLFKIC